MRDRLKINGVYCDYAIKVFEPSICPRIYFRETSGGMAEEEKVRLFS
jgi:hypothetical protein